MVSVTDDRSLRVQNQIEDQTNNYGDRFNVLRLQDHYIGYNSAGVIDISHMYQILVTNWGFWGSAKNPSFG